MLTYSVSETLAVSDTSVRAPTKVENVWQAASSFNPGDSGAPLIDSAGQVVGVVLGRVGYGLVDRQRVQIRDIGWFVSARNALKQVVESPLPNGQLLSVSTAIPSGDVQFFELALRPASLGIDACPPMRPCLPIDGEGGLGANASTRTISAPPGSVIVSQKFSGVENGGSVTLALSPSADSLSVEATVTAEREAFVAGTVSVEFAPAILNRLYPVEIVKDDHPNLLTEDSRDYVLTFDAEPGYTITSASLRARSATRAEPTVVIAKDGRTVQLSCRVTSGPLVDQYRGWFRGEILTTQSRDSSVEGK
jgi:hypothetical protein